MHDLVETISVKSKIWEGDKETECSIKTERERVFQILFIPLFLFKKLIYIGIYISLPYMFAIVQWSVLCRFDPFVLYLEYSTFCDNFFCRAQHQLSLTDRMDCKSQKGRISIGNITRNSDEQNHNCRLNNQKYFIDTRSFKCIK